MTDNGALLETEENRGSALLTQTDREFLRGKKDYSGENEKQMVYQRRRAIRDRVKASIVDLALLTTHREEVETHLTKITVEEWDAALSCLRELHPDPPDEIDPEDLRSIASDLTEKADRLEGVRDGR